MNKIAGLVGTFVIVIIIVVAVAVVFFDQGQGIVDGIKELLP